MNPIQIHDTSNKSNGVSIQGTPSSLSSSIFGLYIGDHQVNFGPNVNSPADDGFTLLDSIDISDMSCDKSIIVNFTPENKYLAVFTKNKIVKIDSIQYLDNDNTIVGYFRGASSNGETTSQWGSNETPEWYDNSGSKILVRKMVIFYLQVK